MNREEALLKSANLFLQAEKIEKSINWNNDAERDSKLGRHKSVLFEALWHYNQAMYGKKGV